MTGPAERKLTRSELVQQLTEAHTHHEPVKQYRNGTWFSQTYRTRVPSLITQLEHAAPSGAGDDRSSRGFTSRPAARLEALDTLIRIDHEAARWLRRLGHDDNLATPAVIRRINGLAASADPDTRDAIERDIRSWWTQARVVTGWDKPAWRPDNTCPLCNKRGGLRIKVMDQHGTCIECGETWGPETLALLAEHIRTENREEDRVS